MSDKVSSERRRILGDAIRQTRAAMGVDVEALAEIQDQFDAQYDKLLPSIAREQAEIAEINAKGHRKMLDDRYTASKARFAGDRITQVYPNCWCDFLKDFVASAVCDHSIPVSDVDQSNHLDTDFDCDSSNNIAKPYAMIRGGGDGITNRVTLVSRLGFNLNDSNFPTNSSYCIAPTVLLSGYWLKENWSGCDPITSSGDIQVILKMTATQLGGTKVLGQKETTVFDWSSGYTGTIDKTYNLAGSATSESFSLIVSVDPTDGDVFVEVTLSINEELSGYGRFLVDMKNSSAFYFWVERVELSRRVCWPVLCKIGGPGSSVECVIGGPGNPVACNIGGPNTVVQCKAGGPDNLVECAIGGPNSPEFCKAGPGFIACGKGPAVGCLAGPPLDVIFDPGLWQSGTVAVDIEKVPREMRRPLSKMFERIDEDSQTEIA